MAHASSTERMVRTRVYRAGRLEATDFPVEEVSDHLEDSETTRMGRPVRPGPCGPGGGRGRAGAARAGGRGRHHQPAAAQARPLRHARVPQRLRGAPRRGTRPAAAPSEIAAFITPHALVTVRKDDRVRHRRRGGPLGRRRRPAQVRRRRSCCTGCSTTSSTATSTPCSRSTSEIEGLEDLLFDDQPTGPGRPAAQLRAAQEPGPAAPRGAADARGRQLPDAPRPAGRRRRR